jgi:hypothetical protein
MRAAAASVTGEPISGFLRVDFDRRLKLQFHGAKLSSDGGLAKVCKGLSADLQLIHATASSVVSANVS